MSDVPVGLYLSRCGGRTDAVGLEALAERFAGDAALVRVVDDFFAPGVIAAITDDVRGELLDAVVLAGNSDDRFSRRSLSGPQLRRALIAAGLSPNRVVSANLLEQVALAHGGDERGAAVKAEAVVAAALLKASLSPPVEMIETVPLRAVLVLGVTGGALIAAQRLLRLGYEVVLADRGDSAERLAEASLSATAAFVASHPSAVFVDEAALTDASGWVGDFEVVLDTPAGRRTLRVGGILVAEPEEAAWTTELKRRFTLDADDDGHVVAACETAHPAETADPGIVLLPQLGEGLSALVTAADSAVMALALQLSAPTVQHYSDTSVVDETLCGGCASCVKTCAFGACSIDPATGLSHVDARRCHGCGKCVVSCPVGARDVVSFPHHYLSAAIAGLASAPVEGPRVLGFLCAGCGYPAADRAGETAAAGGPAYPASFLPLRIPCGGRLDALYVLEAFKQGFDAVAVFRCREGHCRNLIGNVDMDRRINLLRTVLRSRRLDDGRLRIIDISPDEGSQFTDSVNAFYDDISALTNGKGGPL